MRIRKSYGDIDQSGVVSALALSARTGSRLRRLTGCAAAIVLFSAFAASNTAFADRVQGYDRFKFGMTTDEVRTVGPGCVMGLNNPNSYSGLCKGITTASGGPTFYFDPASKRLNGIRIDVVGPAIEGDARTLISSLSRKYKTNYQINDGDIPVFFSTRRQDLAVLAVWQDYSVIGYAYRYGTSRQYVGVYLVYYSDDAAERIRQRLAPLISAQSGSGIDTSKY
ncbi:MULTISPECIES: hypothetical protein [Paraburkholderia]|uniref:hypothetical protein n=1 Tax=Paraburkholderia TaxID=1822464 RepID=UPI0013A6E18F|nr:MULTISPECIES: hypothetical protein [Paraburkholderia]MDH6147057.1 hypothetical protein [Paraburkholderia sp. WSM4179]